MCGRYQLGIRAEMSEHGPGLRPDLWIRQFFRVDVDVASRWNIAPTQEVLALRLLDTAYEAVSLRWGLVPWWAKDKKIAARLLNARSETVATTPAFRSAFQRRRCLIPATGFYEWEKGTKPKQPWRIFLRGDEPYVMAGLWESWTDTATGELLESCTILTTSANELVEPLHDRMPVILPAGARERWVDPEATREALEVLLVPYQAGAMERYRVSTKLNSPANQGAELGEPLA